MTKTLASLLLICIFFIGCNSQQTSQTDKTDKSENSGNSGKAGNQPEKQKKISKRDYSITKTNSYNDIFFDSLVLENFIAERKIPDSLSRRMRSFYNARNYQFAWLSSNGLSEQALAFWNLHNYDTYEGDTSLKDKILQRKMDDLITDSNFTVKATDKSMISTELALTEHFIRYSLNNYEKAYLKRKEMERFIPLKKVEVLTLADSLLNKKHKDNKYFDEVNKAYKELKDQLSIYVDIANSGGWAQINIDPKKLKKGTSSSSTAILKKRLLITNDLIGKDSSLVFDDTLLTAIKHAQQRFGYNPNGILSSALIKDLNVPVMQRIEQLLINLNRMRWMPQEPDGKLILVNIPEFELHFLDGKNKVFDMNVVVGKEGHNTMMFTGKLSTIVFSPYWNVPPSIVKKEIMPKIAANRNYLASQNMEVTGNEGGLPIIRQKPGEKNSLGKVKFLFPNSFNIYFHDTPAKSLFSQDKRAYSHGCIRLSEPLKMAKTLLKDNSQWPEDKIVEAMNSGNEQFVQIKDPIPVFITYYTAWVDENGLLNFRDDIYKRDASVAGKMFVK